MLTSERAVGQISSHKNLVKSYGTVCPSLISLIGRTMWNTINKRGFLAKKWLFYIFYVVKPHDDVANIADLKGI